MSELFNPERIQAANLPAHLSFDPETAALLGNAAFMLRGQHARNLIRGYADPEVIVDFAAPATVPQVSADSYPVHLTSQDPHTLIATSNQQFVHGIVQALDRRERSQLGGPGSSTALVALGVGIPGAVGEVVEAGTSSIAFGLAFGSATALVGFGSWAKAGISEGYRYGVELNPRLRRYQSRLDDAAKRIACLGLPNVVEAA